MRENRLKSGFTLVELLVVIAIIGILIGMLLPAVQQVREAARRSACSNKIRQLAIGCHNYHSAFDHFPSGISTEADASFTPVLGESGWPAGWLSTATGSDNRGAPWNVTIFPHIEQGNLYDQITLTNDFNDSPRASIRSTSHVNYLPFLETVPAFQCPSHADATGVGNTNDPAWQNMLRDKKQLSRNDYLGVMGGGLTNESNYRNNRRLFFSNGILFANSEISVTQVFDGSSNTFLIGESNLPGWDITWSSSFKTGGIACPYNIAGANVPINTLPGNDASLHPYYHTSRSFGSYHSGGCTFAFGDGSTHFLTDSVDIAVYYNLGRREDGNTLADY